MVNVRGYISSNFTKSFLTIFLPFYLIISLVFFVRISSLTSKIQINFAELILLYSYSIPEIIFYTIPISFVAALANVLINLSQGNELIALYSLGLKSKKILNSLLLLGILFSLLLATISFFKEEKRSEAKLNIVPGELGQKFGNYYMYVKEKTGDTFHDIVIYNRTNKADEQFFSSQMGQINHNENVTSLLLHKGYGYTYTKTKLQQAEYETAEIFDRSQSKGFQFKSIISYWSEGDESSKKIMHKILFYIFISLIPFLSVYLVASFTMINPRYQQNHSFLVIFFTTLFFYIIASSLQKWGTPLILILSIMIVTILGQWLFKKRVAKYF
jgi:lipopolysaccharide export system permease protein